MNDRMARFITLVLTFTFVSAPLVSNGFGGFYKESFPVQVDRWPAQPVGWAFSIWGVIYLALLAVSLWAVIVPKQSPGWGRIAWPLAASLLIGSFWIDVASTLPVVATAMILPMTAFAIMAMMRADDDWRMTVPLGLYAGWLTAASGVAISVVLTGYGILGAQIAAIALLIIVLAVSIWIAALRPLTWSYRVGVCWALFGVVIANIDSSDSAVMWLSAAGLVAHIRLGHISLRQAQ